MNAEVGDIVIRFGWQTAIVAFGTLLLIGLFKPLIRKFVTNENTRHAVYQAIQFAFVFVIAYTIRAIEAKAWISPEEMWTAAVAGYTVVNLIYPLYANLSLKELVEKILRGVVGMFTKKSGADKAATPAAETEANKNTGTAETAQTGATDGAKSAVTIID